MTSSATSPSRPDVPPKTSEWDKLTSLPELLLCFIFSKLSPDEKRAFRGACRWARQAVNASVSELVLPAAVLTDYSLHSRFPNVKKLSFAPTGPGQTALTDANLSEFLISCGRKWKLRALDLQGCTHLSSASVAVLSLACPRLQELRLPDKNNSMLRASTLGALASLTTLTDVVLDNCPSDVFTESGLLELGSLTNLKSLALEGAPVQVVKHLEFASNLRLLEQLDLGNTSVSSEALWHLSTLSHLTSLQLYDCTNVTDQELHALQHLTSLKDINLRGCTCFTNAGLSFVKQLPHLQGIFLGRCAPMKAAGIRYLSKCPELTDLEVTSFDLDAPLPGHLQSVRDLTVTGQIPALSLEHLFPISQLQQLKLESCSVDDAAVAAICKQRTLIHLELWKCKLLTDAGAKHFAGLTRLQRLYLGRCRLLSSTGFAKICLSVPGLTSLGLRKAPHVGVEGLMMILTLKRLRKLILSECEHVCHKAVVMGLASLPALQMFEVIGHKQVVEDSYLRQVSQNENLRIKFTEVAAASPKQVSMLI